MLPNLPSLPTAVPCRTKQTPLSVCVLVSPAARAPLLQGCGCREEILLDPSGAACSHPVAQTFGSGLPRSVADKGTENMEMRRPCASVLGMSNA